MPAAVRKATKEPTKAHCLTLFGGLMTVLGFTNKCIKFVNTACKDIKKSQAMEFLFVRCLLLPDSVFLNL